jgi:hypothetical protein
MSKLLEAEWPLKFDLLSQLQLLRAPHTHRLPAFPTKLPKKIEFQDKASLESVVCRILSDAAHQQIDLIDSMIYG